MLILDRRHLLSLAGAAAGASLLPKPARAAIGEAQVHTASDAGALVDSVVILGDESAVLVDAQFIAPEAAALADLIAASGRRLDTVIISHYHPDHILGLDVILQRFPEARAVTHPKIRPLIEQSVAGMLAQFSAGAPEGVFAARAHIPDALEADHVLLEGERIEVIEPIHGDTDLISPVLIPSLDTLIASDLLYQDVHVWVADNTTPDRVQAWRDSLDQLEGMGAGTVIPGHRTADSPDGSAAFAWTRDYLDQWDAALAEAGNADELRAAMIRGREDVGFALAVDRAVAAVYPE
ncbi:MAG: MBL fold metallo-hydrolase [Pseudomonadota bacterium]